LPVVDTLQADKQNSMAATKGGDKSSTFTRYDPVSRG